MTTKESMETIEAQRIAAVFQNLLASKAGRLRTGIQRRQEMFDLMRQDADMSANARWQWLEATAQAVIKTAAERARDFQQQHSDDALSAQDLMDVMERALGLLKAAG